MFFRKIKAALSAADETWYSESCVETARNKMKFEMSLFSLLIIRSQWSRWLILQIYKKSFSTINFGYEKIFN